MDMFEALAAPFPADAVSWRVGNTTADKSKGMALAFIDARDVMERFDAVCGPAGWQCRYPHADNKTVCEIGLKVEAEWIWKADGAGDSDFEAEKGALSDAFKRAAVRWGIGRYLYHLDSPWVKIEAKGKSHFIVAEEKPKLRALLTREGAPRTAEPEPVIRDNTGEELAINLLRGCTADKGLFAEAWNKNKEGWKRTLGAESYSRVVHVMQEIAATFKEKETA